MDYLQEASVMKKYIIVLIAMAILILCLCIYGWIRQAMDKKQAAIDQKELLASGNSIFLYYGDEGKSFAESFDENVVYSLKYGRHRETAMYDEIEDKKVIRQVVDALSRIQVTGETNERTEDFADSFQFQLPMGKSYTFTFEAGNLVTGDKAYTVTDANELWVLATQIVLDNMPVE